jgi:hypothetical protein
MRAHSLNYIERDGRRSGELVNRGFWLFSVPRPLILCRLFGHRPVVDGTTGFRDNDPGSRWVVCDRCGVRPHPQGVLEPTVWNIGDRYTGAWVDPPPADRDVAFAVLKRSGYQLPGPWADSETTGQLGGQIVLGVRHDPKIGFTFKVGNKGSEHTLAADFHLPWIGSLYLHTERFGAWLVRCLNPTGYHSRVVSVEAHNGHLYWRLWAKRDEQSRDDPWWMSGDVQIDPRTILLGAKRYAYEDCGAKVSATVRMPHGDDHPVVLQLQRQTFGRMRGRKRLSWAVDWDAPKGISTEPGGRGRIYGSGVKVSDASVKAGGWPTEAASLIAVRLTEDRRRYDWTPEPAVAQ